MLAEHRREQPRHPRDHLREVDDLGLMRLVPGEGQELPDQVGAVERGAQGIGDALPVLRAVLERTGERVEVPDDHAQHIVEVVRDAAREPPDRIHLLGLQQLLL